MHHTEHRLCNAFGTNYSLRVTEVTVIVPQANTEILSGARRALHSTAIRHFVLLLIIADMYV